MKPTIFLLRYNLRTLFNEALNDATKSAPCYPIFIFDDRYFNGNGRASLVWLHHALSSLAHELNNNISFYKGKTDEILLALVKKHKISRVIYESTRVPSINSYDQKFDVELKKLECQSVVYYQRTLWEISSITKEDNTPYKVFTPFYKKGCLSQPKPYLPKKNANLDNLAAFEDTQKIDMICPLPKKSWAKSIIHNWDISEEGAQNQWKHFLHNGLKGYKDGRNYPNNDNVSRMSPYIHFGQIAVQQLFHETIKFGEGRDRDHFISELGWREFSYYLLHHFPFMTTQNFQSKFDTFPWQFNEAKYKAWCEGKTGYPIVDAGMRELRQTGYMHNRLRMVCGSFLVKNLLIDWRYGEKWFRDCLFDADIANNVAGWQWVAGTGADAAPYFRIFNPVLQGAKFDPDGSYIKRFVPELRNCPVHFLNAPWEASSATLCQYQIELGVNYPYPIVDYKESRASALAALQETKKL